MRDEGAGVVSLLMGPAPASSRWSFLLRTKTKPSGFSGPWFATTHTLFRRLP